MTIHKKQKSSRAGLIVGTLIAVVIAAAAIVAISAGGGGDADKSVNLSQYSDVTVTGTPLPAYDAALSTDPAVGMVPPTAVGKGFTGNIVSTEPSSPLLIVFLAHWCQFCQREVPLLVEWEKLGGAANDIDIMAVATATDPANPNYPPSAWLARENFPALWPVLADDKDKTVGDAYGVTGYPYFVLIGKDGKVAKRMSGAVPMTELTATIEAVLK
jgi:thiol-disulfide isomerase/thioredoxin